VVVTVGINYTQRTGQIPGTAVENTVTTFRGNTNGVLEAFNNDPQRFKNAALCSKALPNVLPLPVDDGARKNYHLVMTNLSPWITTDWWSNIAFVDGRNITAQLLSTRASSSTGRHPFEHIRELKEAFDQQKCPCPPAVWIGHGMPNIWEHFVILMEQLDVERWLLASELAYPLDLRILERADEFHNDVQKILRELASREKMLRESQEE
jgi:hypothetical protein